MLMWNHHLSSVITKRWSEKLILGNLVTKFPLISMRKGIWLFNLQENLMGILRTANTLLHQLLKFFLAFLLYLQHELVYRKDLHHFPYLHIAMLSLCVGFFFFLYMLCIVQLICWTAKHFKNVYIVLKHVFSSPNCIGHSMYGANSWIMACI